MTTINTLEDLRQFITAATEDRTMPDAVSEWCAKNAGKVLRGNNVPPGLSVSRRYGMTQLVSQDYFRSEGNAGYSFLLSYKEVGVVVPTVTELRGMNTCYYFGLEDRNAKRLALVNDADKLNTLLYAVQELSTAAANYRRAVGVFEEVCNYPDGVPDYYALRKLAGWIEERR